MRTSHLNVLHFYEDNSEIGDWAYGRTPEFCITYQYIPLASIHLLIVDRLRASIDLSSYFAVLSDNNGRRHTSSSLGVKHRHNPTQAKLSQASGDTRFASSDSEFSLQKHGCEPDVVDPLSLVGRIHVFVHLM